MISFADSVTPQLINRAEFSHVAAYVNGRFAWPRQQLARFPYHILISVTGDPTAARLARVQDDELFDATPEDFPPFMVERHAAGHDDPTSYTSIIGDPGFGIVNVLAAIQSAGLFDTAWRLWVAWYWGRPFPPTAAEVLAEIKALTGITLEPGRLWACQWQNTPQLDRSVLYGRDDFARQA